MIAETNLKWTWLITLPSGEQTTLTQFKPRGICPADITTAGALTGDVLYGIADGVVTQDDFDLYMALYLAADPLADLSTAGANPGDPVWGVSDGLVTADDLVHYVAIFNDPCPQQVDPTPIGGGPMQYATTGVIIARSCRYVVARDAIFLPHTTDLVVNIWGALEDLCETGDPQWVVDAHLDIDFLVSFGSAVERPEVVGRIERHQSNPPDGPPADEWSITALVRVDWKIGLFLPVNHPFMGIGKWFSRIHFCGVGVCCCID